MLTSQRPPPMFVGASAALDFLNSIAAPRDIEFEWLETGPDLLDWLIQAGICLESEVAHLRANVHRADLDRAAQKVREFRDEFRDFIQTASETSQVPVEDPLIDQINDLLAQGTQRLRIEIAPLPANSPDPLKQVDLTSVHTYQTAQDLLPRVAAACAELICNADFGYVRNCQGPNCTLYFLDVSKNHKRRWCSMDVCGNRAKAAAHRRR